MLNIDQSSTEVGVADTFLYQNEQRVDPFLSDEARAVLEIVFTVALNGPINLLGIAANIVNIIIFIKQGFTDSVNISLCALAVSDMGCLLALLWVSVCFIPLFRYSDIGFDSVEIHTLTGDLPHTAFARTTGLITAFITFERCVCVSLPLEVKNIITPKRTLISIVAMSAVAFVTTVPLFSSVYFSPSFHAKQNKTLIGLKATNYGNTLLNFSVSSTLFVQFSGFMVVIICTVMLVLKLHSTSQWRHRVKSVSDVSDPISTRDKRVMKMTAFISIFFIICYLPNVVNSALLVGLSPEYRPEGRYGNSYTISRIISDMIEAINSATSILIYYNMSSKFRATFRQLLFIATVFSAQIQTYIRARHLQFLKKK